MSGEYTMRSHGAAIPGDHFEDASQTINPDETSPHADSAHVNNQYAATATSEQLNRGVIRQIDPPIKQWTPIPLRRWYAISLLSFMFLVAVALEVALHFSRTQNGWKVSNQFSATTGIMHFIYTLPPVGVAMVIIALWAWTDLEIKMMQPYIDLAYGNAPASRTILLDYSTQHAALVSVSAYRHHHYLVALSSFMVLTGLAIQPLAASLFTVKQIWWNAADINVSGLQSPGLDSNFGNLTAFTTAAGFVQANVLYNATPPNFVRDIWAIAQVQVPSDRVSNGTMFANTTGVRSLGHCKAGDSSNISPFVNGTGFTLSGTSDGCSISIPTPSNASVQYGVEVLTCPNSPPPDPLKPVVFWTLSQSSLSAAPAYSLVYCTPTIELLNVAIQVALQTGDLLNATITTNFTQPNILTDPNGPLGGRTMNGVAFNLSNADFFTQQRGQTAKSGLSEAITQKARMSSGGLDNQIQSFGMISLTESVYNLYLTLVAKENYFVTNHTLIDVGIKTVQPRLFIVDATAHVLTSVLIAFAVLGAFIHVVHYRTREVVVLPRRLGTIASAAAFTARSNVGDMLDGNLDETALARILKNKRFKIDKITGRIVMEGTEVGYGTSASLIPITTPKVE